MALVSLVSCNTDAEGTLYKFSDRQELSFASKLMSSEVTQEDNGVVKVPVFRGKADGEFLASVALKGTGENSPFSLKSDKVTFPAGENVAYVELSFGSLDQLDPVGVYEMSLSLTDKEQMSPGGVETIGLKINRKLTWEAFGKGTYTSSMFEESWEQPIEKAAEGEVYRLPGWITEGFHLVFTVNSDDSIDFGKQETGYVHSSYGMISYGPAATGSVKNGKEFVFIGNFTVKAGSFGAKKEVFVMD